jgi:hypothetical protein
MRRIPPVRRTNIEGPQGVDDGRSRMPQTGAGCVRTPPRFRTMLFRSLFRGFTAFRIGKFAKNIASLDRLQIFAEFSHGLGGLRAYRGRLGKAGARSIAAVPSRARNSLRCTTRFAKSAHRLMCAPPSRSPSDAPRGAAIENDGPQKIFGSLLKLSRLVSTCAASAVHSAVDKSAYRHGTSYN